MGFNDLVRRSNSKQHFLLVDEPNKLAKNVPCLRPLRGKFTVGPNVTQTPVMMVYIEAVVDWPF